MLDHMVTLFLRNLHIVLHSTIVVLIYYSHQQCRRVSFAPQLLSFVILITICCSVFLYRTVCASWIWVTISFPRLGKFSAIISSSYIFSGPFSLSSPFQFSSVAQSCPTLCNPINCSRPGLPVHHQLPEFTQTHVH